MANVAMHIKNWLSKATPDYYTMFIKAWIPLNAWYVVEYGTRDDRTAIKKLKSEYNKIKNRIEALLLNDDTEAKDFRFHLAQLHLQLEQRRIQHRDKFISFSSIELEENDSVDPITEVDKSGNVYKATKEDGFYHALIVRDKGKGKSLMDKKFNSYNISDLLSDSQYIGLNDSEIQETIRLCYQMLDPNKTMSLVSKSRLKADKIVLDPNLKIEFVNKPELISKSLIQTIYNLRCTLFHGEIDPTETNHEIFEHSFYILKSIINELK